MKKISVFIVLVSLSIVFIFSCQKDTIYKAGESNNLRTTVTGIVSDESNAPLSDVTVTAYGQTTATNEYGAFVLKNINANKDRCVLEFSKSGFFNRTHGFIASGNTVNYVNIVLMSNAASQTVSASSGGTVVLTDGSTVDFQPNSFVTAANGSAYSGTVNIAIKHLSPDDDNFGFMSPGGDLLGKNLNDEDVVLISYGMLGVELTGGGEALQLAPGTTATLTMSIAASQLASAPATIPLWYFDETTSLWKEEGTANKVGNNYVGTVQHFSWWNYDYQGPKSFIQGKVVDCNGVPLPNMHVTVNGWYIMTTNQNGEFYDAVPCGMTFTIQVLASNNPGLTTDGPLLNIPALTANHVYTVPDMIVSCATKVAGTLSLCNGESANGFVYITDSAGFNRMAFTSNSSFNSIVIPNTELYLTASDFIGMNKNHQTISAIPQGEVLNLGAIALCDLGVAATSTNNFTLTGGPFSNELFEIHDSAAYTYGTNTVFWVMSGPIPPDKSIVNFYCCMYHNIPGTYNNGIDFSITFYNFTTATQYMLQVTANPSLVLNLTQFDPFGGRVKGSFSSDGTLYTNGANPVPANMIFNFDLLRD
jgi:hypothetical protein